MLEIPMFFALAGEVGSKHKNKTTVEKSESFIFLRLLFQDTFEVYRATPFGSEESSLFFVNGGGSCLSAFLARFQGKFRLFQVAGS